MTRYFRSAHFLPLWTACFIASIVPARAQGFRIPPIIIKGIFVSAPKTGDTAVTGVPVTVGWAAYGDSVGIYGFAVEVWKGGALQKRIANAKAADRSLQWIPDAGLPAGSDYTIKVWDFASDGGYSGESTPFVLRFVYPQITVLAPTAQDTAFTGKPFTIRWSTAGFTPGGAKLYLLNGVHHTVGDPVQILGTAATLSGAFAWTPATDLADGLYNVYVQDTVADLGGDSFNFNVRAGAVTAVHAAARPRIRGLAEGFAGGAGRVLFQPSGAENTAVSADGRAQILKAAEAPRR